MGYLIATLAIGLFFLILHNFTELNLKQKLIATLVVFLVILSALFYNNQSNAQSQKTLDVITKFKQGKSIKCQDKEVNNTNYSLSVGTYTFIGKNKTSAEGLMINVSACE
ncbi:hypothetical protein [Sulfurimonas sp.]|uniref:hypothetical protein n=1 Tax=Sulfurimonas sp. TaxID=2022749 RepID=UPI0025E9320C|nr:hypothetical protein [Sulfurimonas sp.]MDD5156685.1 hypothetical protein [Sulfurimonas sp.]